MCIVIGMNTIPKVSDKKNLFHTEFEPVYNWILNDIGKFVIGGTTYYGELSKMSTYLRFVNILRDKKKVIKVQDNLVDNEENKIIEFLNDKKCDDPHILALLKVSKCQLLCSNDDRMFPYIRKVYTKNRPKIYYSSKNINLLNIKNIPKIYQN